MKLLLQALPETKGTLQQSPEKGAGELSLVQDLAGTVSEGVDDPKPRSGLRC